LVGDLFIPQEIKERTEINYKPLFWYPVLLVAVETKTKDPEFIDIIFILLDPRTDPMNIGILQYDYDIYPEKHRLLTIKDGIIAPMFVPEKTEYPHEMIRFFEDVENEVAARVAKN